LRRLGGVGDLLQLPEDELRHDERAVDEPCLDDIGDAPVDDHAGVEELAVLAIGALVPDGAQAPGAQPVAARRAEHDPGVRAQQQDEPAHDAGRHARDRLHRQQRQEHGRRHAADEQAQKTSHERPERQRPKRPLDREDDAREQETGQRPAQVERSERRRTHRGAQKRRDRGHHAPQQENAHVVTRGSRPQRCGDAPEAAHHSAPPVPGKRGAGKRVARLRSPPSR
jgi:hypothetical protein